MAGKPLENKTMEEICVSLFASKSDGLDNNMQVVLVIILHSILILTFSHLLHHYLKRISIPSAISQVLAGVLLGRTLWRSLPLIGTYFFSKSPNQYLSVFSDLGRYLFMFLIGLEIDLAYMLRTKRIAFCIAAAGILTSTVVVGIFLLIFHGALGVHGLKIWIILAAAVASTGSPLLFRICADLKLVSSEISRIALSTALMTEFFCLILLAFLSDKFDKSRDQRITSMFNVEIDIEHYVMKLQGYEEQHIVGVFEIEHYVMKLIALVVALAASAYFFRRFVKLVNRMRPRRYMLKHSEMAWIFIMLLGVGSLMEIIGFSSAISCFVVGLFFPRDGKASRSIMEKLGPPVHNFVLPVYFGYMGMRADLSLLKHFGSFCLVLSIIGMSLVVQVAGSFAGQKYLKLPSSEGMFLTALLGVKAHAAFDLVRLGERTKILHHQSSIAVITGFVLCNLVTGPLLVFSVQRQRSQQVQHEALESVKPITDLRILACLYSRRCANTMLSIIEMFSRSEVGLLTVSIMHLTELLENASQNLLFNQCPEEEDDNSDLGGQDTGLISDAVDTFIRNTNVPIRLLKACSKYESMYDDICNVADEMCASMVILPFHKHRLFDGSIGTIKQGYRLNNCNVQMHSRCTVAMLVDRGPVEAQNLLEETKHLAVIFFGGPDDREAAAYALRMVEHPTARLSLLRFLPSNSETVPPQINKKDDMLASTSSLEMEKELDGAFLHDFYKRYVELGKASYSEKYASNVVELEEEIKKLDGVFSLYIVGKGETSLLPFEIDSSSQECQELGVVGDLLASDLFSHGSVLVIQHCRTLKISDIEIGFTSS